jgi:hypothetical protein
MEQLSHCPKNIQVNSKKKYFNYEKHKLYVKKKWHLSKTDTSLSTHEGKGECRSRMLEYTQ